MPSRGTDSSSRSSGIFIRRFLTPDYSILIQSVLAVVLFVLGDIENMIGYFTVSYALQNGIVYGAIFFLRGRDDYHPTLSLSLVEGDGRAGVLTQIAVGAGTFLAYPLGGLLASLFLILSGMPIYLYYMWRKRRRPESIA